MKIHIETEPFAIDYWYDGSVTIDLEDVNKQIEEIEKIIAKNRKITC